MDQSEIKPRVLYSFPFRIGSNRICITAGFQVSGADSSGVRMTVLAGSLGRTFRDTVRAQATLSVGTLRVPIRLVGDGLACQLHDWITSRWLENNASSIDLVHGWPLASLLTIEVAKRHGIPFLLERPNAHTEYAYEATAEECDLLGITMPHEHDHSFSRDYLRQEEIEYHSADYLLCPSDFVSSSFLERSFQKERILRHQYGYDPNVFESGCQDSRERKGLVMLYAGVCEPRKGLHYALQAWLTSGAQERGKFLICGEFLRDYEEKLQGILNHRSIEVLGYRDDLPKLMKSSDLFVLSSVEEGSALVTYEAKASGCVLMVTDAVGAKCNHLVDAMVHPMRDYITLAEQIRTLDRNRSLLERLRSASLLSAKTLTWNDAGQSLAQIYRNVTLRLFN